MNSETKKNVDRMDAALCKLTGHRWLRAIHPTLRPAGTVCERTCGRCGYSEPTGDVGSAVPSSEAET